jgi:hypothetical protein
MLCMRGHGWSTRLTVVPVSGRPASAGRALLDGQVFHAREVGALRRGALSGPGLRPPQIWLTCPVRVMNGRTLAYGASRASHTSWNSCAHPIAATPRAGPRARPARECPQLRWQGGVFDACGQDLAKVGRISRCVDTVDGEVGLGQRPRQVQHTPRLA